jgi:CubicO group peptidase (beta-lactamase class C family)
MDLTRLTDVMEHQVADGNAGALTWGVVHGGEVHAGAAGNARRDTIFRIASMTKPIVAAAAMALVERCELRLDDPVDDLLPELADRRVMRDPSGSLEETVPAERPISLRDLLTFRTGIGMDFTRFGQQPLLEALHDRAGVPIGPPRPQEHVAPDDFLAILGELPLERQPGERWLYNTSSDILGVLVARATGGSLEQALRALVLDPLGMDDTSFSVPATKLDRFGPCSTDEAEFDPAEGGQWASAPPFESGAGGLVSTVDDYVAFARMLHEGGGDVLSPSSVSLMTTNHLTQAQLAANGGDGWGFGVGVIVERTTHEHVGAYGWTGGLGSSWSNDPTADLITVLLTDRLFTSPSLPVAHQDLVTLAHVAAR